MHILITGGSGFLGSHVVERAAAAGHQVSVLDLAPPSWTPGVTWRSADVGDATAVTEAVEATAPDAVVHMAGLLGTSETFDHPQATARTNVIGALNVLEACRRARTRFVGIQTGSVWRNPYAITKWAAAELARAYHEAFGIPVTQLRVFNAFGPRQDGVTKVEKLVPRFAVNALRGDPLPVFGDGTQTVDLIHAEDCAECVVRAIERAPGKGELIDVGTGAGVSVLDVAGRILDVVGGGELRFLPRRIGEGSTYPVADTRATREQLGFVPPVALERLGETVEWYERHVAATASTRADP